MLTEESITKQCQIYFPQIAEIGLIFIAKQGDRRLKFFITFLVFLLPSNLLLARARQCHGVDSKGYSKNVRE